MTPLCVLFQQGSQPSKRLTDIQDIQNYLRLEYKHPRNVSKRFQKDISSRTKDNKQFSQLYTHGHMDMSESRADHQNVMSKVLFL